MTTQKSTVEEIRQRFDAEAGLYTNLETGQVSAVDSALAMSLVAEAAAVTTPHATASSRSRLRRRELHPETAGTNAEPQRHLG